MSEGFGPQARTFSLCTGTGETPRQYAAILMDANMPVIDGFFASRLIPGTHGTAHHSLNAAVLEQDRQRCREVGVVGF